MSIETYKNFLTIQEHKELFNLITSPNFAWHQIKCLSPPLVSNDIQFCHWLKDVNSNPSTFLQHFKTIFDKLDVHILHRAKLNLTIQDKEIRILGGYHHDVYRDYEHTQPLKELKIALYYFNNTNGQTYIKKDNNINKIDCEANSLVTFSNNLEHTGTTHTDTKFRYVLNINYI